jgi:dephospho-CoA kinase
MVVIGVTGNIGSGKSSVCRILGRLGAMVIDADRLAHEAYEPHSETWRELIDAFGKNIVKPDEEIDRQKLGQIVFSDPDALAQLNRIVHPGAYRLAQERIADCRRQGAKAVVVEATLLIEAGWQGLVDRVWLVVAPEAAIVQRLKEQQGMGESQILARLKSQMTAEEKMPYADAVIYNDGNIPRLEARVTELWRNLNIG